MPTIWHLLKILAFVLAKLPLKTECDVLIFAFSWASVLKFNIVNETRSGRVEALKEWPGPEVARSWPGGGLGLRPQLSRILGAWAMQYAQWAYCKYWRPEASRAAGVLPLHLPILGQQNLAFALQQLPAVSKQARYSSSTSRLWRH